MSIDSLEDILFDLEVAPAVSLDVASMAARKQRSPIARGIGDVSVNLLHGDCLEVMSTLEDNSVDSIVTDPPYGLAALPASKITETLLAWCSGDRSYIPEGAGFMGRTWDAFIPPPAVWDEAYRVLKPGGHIVAFSGSRTQDLMGMAIRLAGFEVRDNLAWLYGSGFPKSLDVSKAIDREAGAEREVIGSSSNGIAGGTGRHAGNEGAYGFAGEFDLTAPATEAAEYWQGWGTALKPAHEPVILARKPLSESTVAKNVLVHGTGAINVDACRIESGADYHDLQVTQGGQKINGGNYNNASGVQRHEVFTPASGRFPANILLDAEAAVLLDEQGDASRFFMVADELEVPVPFLYSAKAPKSERPVVNGVAHVTVKPLSVMRWLVKLVTPPGGIVLEPFAGSGTTVEAAVLEGFDCIAIEREEEYIPLIESRVQRLLNRQA